MLRHCILKIIQIYIFPVVLIDTSGILFLKEVLLIIKFSNCLFIFVSCAVLIFCPYGYGMLTAFASESSAETYIASAIYDASDEIDLSRYELSSDELKALVNKVANENTFSWHIAGKSYSYSTDEYKHIVSVKFGYVSDIPEKQYVIDNVIDNIAALTDKNSFNDNSQKVNVVILYFMQHYRYDNRDIGYCNDVYRLFTTGMGRCSSLALSFKAVMDKLNIPCRIVSDNKLCHAYNEVYINNVWKKIDLTSLVFCNKK